MKRIDFERIFDNIRRDQTMVHCITNYVTINDVANMILAIGASPIMADDWMEVREITAMCDSLVINFKTKYSEIHASCGKRSESTGSSGRV